MATKSQSQISSIDDEITQEDPVAAAVEAATVSGSNFDSAMSGKKEMVTIHSSGEDGGSDAVFVSINGYAYQIPRDKPFLVPTEVAQGLRDARVTTYRSGPSGAVIEEHRQRYAFSAVPA